jgi:hypothetical protein
VSRMFGSVPEYKARITRRAEGRARLELSKKEAARLAPEVGLVLLLDSRRCDDGFEVVAAEVYAVHLEGTLVDVDLRAEISADLVNVKRTGIGK